jgi:hypothetical protein
MARFRPFRRILAAVRRAFAPEPVRPPAPPPRPRATARPRPSPQAPAPSTQRPSRFYTRDVPPELQRDSQVSQLVSAAYFDKNLDADTRLELRQALHDYVEAEFDLRWEDYFDWDAWREAMGY